ncbi:MAG TPA: serine hydrolase domain-containing protein [Bacteroidia bacterium]|nr:serine hydrolase domain-containing protein [Bacteroidia bacterium]HRH09494.1 serine hydrolase domain-containing protein [Bacteroidia bacterium]
MSKINVSILVALFVCFTLTANSQQKEFNAYYDELHQLNQFNGNVLFAKNNTILFQNSYNITGVNDSFKVDPQSKFIIASVSKVFIKVAILKLAELGKLNLSDSLVKFLPDFPNATKITVEQLMLHKSGLPREISDYEKYDKLSLNQAIDLAKKESLVFEPNTQTAYSNVGYFLLHYIIEKASGKNYFLFMQEDVFNKLKLENTFEYNNAAEKRNFVFGFTNENAKVEATETRTINQFETGNIITTINDLYKFCREIISSEFISDKSKSILFKNDSMLVQAGGRKGYRAYLSINLKSNTTFIFLSNQTNIPFDEIVKASTNIYEGKPFQLPKVISRKEIDLPAEFLKKYEGIFVSKEHKLHYTLKLIDKNLVIIEPDDTRTKLFAEDENNFFDNPKSTDNYTFVKNGEGKITALQIASSGMKFILQKQ